MIIEIKRNYEEIVISVSGRLDSITTPMLEKTIDENVNNNDDLIFDFKNLKYISNAGLLLLIKTKDKMRKGFMRIMNVCAEVMNEFEINGVTDNFIIE